MIHYTLKCRQGHEFDSWFQTAAAYEKLLAAELVTCSVCGSGEVEKAVMAPRVRTGPDRSDRRPAPLAEPRSPTEQALDEIRRHVEATSDYVGDDFAREARAIHEGAARRRSIWGEARSDEARRLAEDGIPVAPLPFLPSRKSN